MGLLNWGKLALLPGPHRLVEERLRYVAFAMTVLGTTAIFAHLRPAAWSATWWLALAALLMGLTISLVRWRRVCAGGPVPATLLANAIAAGVLFANPAHSEVGMLFILITAFIAALYHGMLVLLHLLVFSVILAVHVWQGGDAGTSGFVALSAASIMVFLRGLNVALHDQLAQTETLRSLMQILPVLKAHGVQEVIRAAVRHLVQATASDSGIVMVLSPDARTLRPFHIYAEKPMSEEEESAYLAFELPVTEGIAGWAARNAQPAICGDAEQDPRGRHVPGTPFADESLMVVPLMTHGNLYGVLRLNRAGLNQYQPGDLRLLELMAAHVSDALSRAAMEERLARTDALTGVYNRHYLNEWSQRLEPGEREISVLMIDCRRFKDINDRWGHLVGDWVLQEAARLISETVRHGDLVVRYGGDEFLVVLHAAGADEATRVAHRLVAAVHDWNLNQPAGGPSLTLDVGTDTALESQWLDLLCRADALMYASKRAS